MRSTLGVPASGTMKMRAATIHRVMAGLMLAQWLALVAFATSERLHHTVCDESQQSSHDCALVSLARGQLWTAFEIVAAPAVPSRAIDDEAFRSTVSFSSIDLRLMPGRGPPACLAVL